jgi:hypothetical protein
MAGRKGGKIMPIVAGTNTNETSINRVTRCKLTFVKATGRATARAATRAAARAQARGEAQRQLNMADARARGLPCPARGGCPRPCRQGPPLLRGFGTNTTRPRRVAGQWQASCTMFRSYDINCSCPRRG